MKKLAPPKARELLAKLTALAERGINGEREAAKLALAKLKRRYDFASVNTGGADIFAGVFIADVIGREVFPFEPHENDIANAVKWAIEHGTKIRCGFRGQTLIAAADDRTATRLHDIAGTLAQSFGALWRQFESTPGSNKADRSNFILGLYDGMMDEAREGELLPRRAHVEKVKKARKRDLTPPPGLSVHPYSVAVNLGKQIRCCATLDEITAELENAVKGQLPNVKEAA